MLLTIGHSNHSLEMFLDMLKEQKVSMIADVRSTPRSSYCPYFDKKQLQETFKEQKMRYVYLKWLGGRPGSKQFYDVDGHADYKKVSQQQYFQDSLEIIERMMNKNRVVIMCSEEDPNLCHRRLLVVEALCQQDIEYADEIFHIRKGGILESEKELRAREETQPSLWEKQWRSPKPIKQQKWGKHNEFNSLAKTNRLSD